jgi:sialic acid synthase SpsE
MRDALGVAVGYSDHVPNNYACYAAVALGAEVIEKHFTLDKNMEGPDHKCSLEPEEFRELIAGVRAVEQCLGSGVKIPSQSEVNNTYGMRRSLVARNDIKAGTILTEVHFGFKRPANGLSPNYLETLIGKKLAKDMLQDEAFTFESILF